MKNTRTELLLCVESIREDLTRAYEGWDQKPGDLEETFDLVDYINENALDIEYTIGSDKGYRGCRIAVTLGGPNIYINTRRGAVEGYWGTERAEAWIPSEICAEIDSLMEMDFECL